MAMYAIKDTTLTALGDVVRKTKFGASEVEEHLELELDMMLSGNNMYMNYLINPKYSLYNKVIVDIIEYEDYLDGYVYISDGYFGGKTYLNWTDKSITHFEFNTDTSQINFAVYYGRVQLNIVIIPIDENGNEFKYTPAEMINHFNNLNILPDEALTITGAMSYRFSNGVWNWFIERYGDKITTKDCYNYQNVFYNNTTIKNIPFELNCNNNQVGFDYGFSGCSNLEIPPTINNFKVGNMGNMFNGCHHLREFPEDYGANWDFSYIDSLTSAYGGGQSQNIFQNCYSLRKLPLNLLKHGNPYQNYNYVYFKGLYGLYSLDEATNLPYPYTAATYTGSGYSGIFNETFQDCYRLKELTFATNEDGTPITAMWSNQTINLSVRVGYDNYQRLVNYSQWSGITADKRVYDDATYQALKNDPDWFSTDANYSRYNHDSAVNTINSLPDTTATGTNTIKFFATSGALTDGGAINTLTEEEIAVATAKGWTVAYS